MNRSLFRITAYLQLGITILVATGCAPIQPYFAHESPDLQHYLNSATSIEYPDVDVEHLAETTGTLPPLALGNHDYQFWDLTLEECVSTALQNAKFFLVRDGVNVNVRNIDGSSFVSGNADQFGSIYDVAIRQSTTQSIPLTVDGNGNRVLPRGVLRANQIGGVEDALAEFDAQASGFINYSKTDRLSNNIASTVTVPTAIASDMTQQSAISKRFATGSVATLRQQFLFSRNNTPTVNAGGLRAVASDWTALIEAQVQHPLMRNRGTMINRIPVVLASLNEDESIANFEIQVRNLVRDVETVYWDLYVAYRNVSTLVIARNSAIATAQFARLQLQQGIGTRQDLAQAVAQYYQILGDLESALAGSNLVNQDRRGVYGRERELRELMGLSATDGRLIRPIQEPSIARVEFDWNDSVAQMLYLSPELRRNKTRLKQSELELVSAKNQILPEVNLSLLYRWVGVGDHLGPPERRSGLSGFAGSSALQDLTGGSHQEGAIRLEITPPAFGARRELTRIRGAHLRLLREKGYLQDQERLLVSSLSDAVAKTSTHFQLVQTNAQRWQASEEEVEARLAEYTGGRSQINTVLQSQQRRAEAQIAYYRALGEYNKSINLVDYLKGTMLANSNITLAEGPWNKKAYWDALERARERSSGKELQYGVTRPGVVRRGPVRNADHALEIIGSGAAGDALPADSIIIDGLDAGMNLEPYRESIEVDDQPLGELDSPAELLAPGIESIAPGTKQIAPPAEPIAPGEVETDLGPGETLPMPVPDAIPQGGQGNLRPPTTTTDGPRVAPASYETDVEVSNAPKPVRRKPLPSAR